MHFALVARLIASLSDLVGQYEGVRSLVLSVPRCESTEFCASKAPYSGVYLSESQETFSKHPPPTFASELCLAIFKYDGKTFVRTEHVQRKFNT